MKIQEILSNFDKNDNMIKQCSNSSSQTLKFILSEVVHVSFRTADHIYEVFRVIDSVPLFLEDQCRAAIFTHWAGMQVYWFYSSTYWNPEKPYSDMLQGILRSILWRPLRIVSHILWSIYVNDLYPTEQNSTRSQTGILSRRKENLERQRYLIQSSQRCAERL